MCQIVGNLLEQLKESFQFCGLLIPKEDFAEFQMRTFYATLFEPFHTYSMPGTKQKQSAASYIIVNSLKRGGDLGMFVRKTCQGIEKLPKILEPLTPEKQLELGLFLKEFGRQLISIQILSIAKAFLSSQAKISVKELVEEMTKFNKII